MNKFIKNIIYFSLRHRYFVFFMTAVMVVIGIFSYRNTPIETFPDVTNTQIIIIAQWPGRSAEEVEKFVTIPLEVALNSVQKKSNLRSTSAFGLSYIRIIFDDDVDDAFARQQVYTRLGNADLPDDDVELRPTWNGAQHINKIVMIGVPNEGTTDAFSTLVEGYSITEGLRRWVPLLNKLTAKKKIF